jgi:anti-sigma regulatory factor (Ser/Thr protein kinase)
MDQESAGHHEFPVLGKAYFMGGRASTSVKRVLAAAGIDDEVIQRVSVACYEAEMNVVLHARSGFISLDILPDRIVIEVHDQGPGIEDVGLAMTRGWSSASDEARALGFGAGMGLPNIKDHADDMRIESVAGRGVSMVLTFYLGDRVHE